MIPAFAAAGAGLSLIGSLQANKAIQRSIRSAARSRDIALEQSRQAESQRILQSNRDTALIRAAGIVSAIESGGTASSDTAMDFRVTNREQGEQSRDVIRLDAQAERDAIVAQYRAQRAQGRRGLTNSIASAVQGGLSGATMGVAFR